MFLKVQEIIFIGFLEKNYFWKNLCFSRRTIKKQKLSNRPIIWHRCSFCISSDRVRGPKKSVHYGKRYLRLKILFLVSESRFLQEYLIYWLEILTSYCTNSRLYVVRISRDDLHWFFRKKLFLKNFAFSSSHDNKRKNYAITLKFFIYVDFSYLQIEFVAQKNRFITKKDISD